MKLPVGIYWAMIASLTTGYLIPSVLTNKIKLALSFLVWIPAGVFALMLYDYSKSMIVPSHAFLQGWQKYYAVGLLLFLGLHAYTRFTSRFILQQLTKT